MILGLPVPSWLLLVAAVGAGLILELAFFRARRRERRAAPEAPRAVRDDAGAGPGGGA